MIPHKILRFLNPDNKEKIEIGSKKLQFFLEKWNKRLKFFVDKYYSEKINDVKKNIEKFQILKNDIMKKVDALKNEIKELETRKKEALKEEDKMKGSGAQDQKMLGNFKTIGARQFEEQRNSIIEKINKSKSVKDKVELTLLLGLMYKDYEKLMIE